MPSTDLCLNNHRENHHLFCAERLVALRHFYSLPLSNHLLGESPYFMLLFTKRSMAFLMISKHPKSVRRRLLTILYNAYFKEPLDMLSPQDILEEGSISREDLLANAYYLHDRQLIELMVGYNPPMFAAARITAKGIDLVENAYEFNLLFPPDTGDYAGDLADLPILVERLVEEADFSPLDGEARRCLLRDVQYLRDELARPEPRWRIHVIRNLLDWIAEPFDDPDEQLPSLPKIRDRIAARLQ